jgi:hypothetical protein
MKPLIFTPPKKYFGNLKTDSLESKLDSKNLETASRGAAFLYREDRFASFLKRISAVYADLSVIYILYVTWGGGNQIYRIEGGSPLLAGFLSID